MFCERGVSCHVQDSPCHKRLRQYMYSKTSSTLQYSSKRFFWLTFYCVLLSGAVESAELLGCTYFWVQAAVQDYCYVQNYTFQCRTIGMHLLFDAGGRTGLTGTLIFWCRWQCRTIGMYITYFLIVGTCGSAGLL